jgi:hypothetical protein
MGQREIQMASRDEADKVKAHLRDLLSAIPEVCGVGLVRLGEGWAVRVNVLAGQESLIIPTSIDGVSIQRHDLTGQPRVHTLDRPIHLVVHDGEFPAIQVVPFTEELI